MAPWSVIFLGSGQDAGVPQLFCRCTNCELAKQDKAHRRTACAVAIMTEDNGCYLLDASPDIRFQFNSIIDTEIHPKFAHCELRGIFLTHAHIGHIAGLQRLGKEGPNKHVPVYATPALLKLLSSQEPYASLFKVLGGETLEPGASVQVDGLTFTFHKINHRDELSDTVGIEVSDGQRRFLYIPDTDRIDERVHEAAANLQPGDVLSVDGTFFSGDELPNRNLEEIPHPFISNSMEQLKPHLEKGVRVIYTHLNHSNAVCRPASKEHRTVLAAGYEVAHDGLVWTWGE
eukprot:NODE_2444_length_1063_cov_72.793803_g2426_i0.p1 GENE.NODE_2444_length_1063_cov_72.793803_g2426_i0~~NODE_2444_length_1063_cov_72.793803_g2426_i0.p1  ORF type:complete len:288 (-),score=17.80 NODE_2444_length_1063_cov_72.793803_g2426_i0:106-969(-)